jgi:hypothetical protein
VSTPRKALQRNLAEYWRESRTHEQAANLDAAWAHLESAHILGQRSLRLHVRCHWTMFGLAWRTRNRDEAIGQVMRLLAAMLFTRFWVPAGNSGRAHHSAFAKQPIPRDLRQTMNELGVESKRD